MTQTRRRGAALEAAIYLATREILAEDGLAGLTFPKVADRANTSKPVIYRRWDSPFALAIAALQDKIKRENNGRTDEIKLTGRTLAEDLTQVLKRFTVSMKTFDESYLGSLMGGLNKEQGAAIQRMIAEGNAIDINAIDRVVKRAQDRDELGAGTLPDQVKLLPFDLLRYHLFVNQEFSDAELASVIDDVLLPAYHHALEH